MPKGSTPAETANARRRAQLATSEPWSKDRMQAVAGIGRPEREQRQTRENAAARQAEAASATPPKPRPAAEIQKGDVRGESYGMRKGPISWRGGGPGRRPRG